MRAVGPRSGGAVRPTGVVITCEHASRAIPPELGDLGLSPEVLASHRAWDLGAARMARDLYKPVGATLVLGTWSRLVVDLNRSPDHPGIIARRLDGQPVPGNQLNAWQRRQRVATYWSPWREMAEDCVVAAAQRGVVLHLSVHSFTPQLHGKVRCNDIGLLHDPHRPLEVAWCETLKSHLVDAGLSVRRNFPYFGNTDGFTSHLRRVLPPADYLGIEIECNQRLVATKPGQRRVARALCAAMRHLLGI